ncbi:MAG TPA: hypothetical protein VEG30_01535 [Terriglobales bacterium]|nr:hypothetical protein [Terriglobales bacterium]
MDSGKQELLDKLKFELAFLEQGGYGRSVRTPWKPTSIFQDSVTCLNYGEPDRPHSCSECMLIDFVPEQFRNETVPCHHIPLDAKGNTVETLDQGYNQARLEDAVVQWLRQVIARLERECGSTKAPLAT